MRQGLCLDLVSVVKSSGGNERNVHFSKNKGTRKSRRNCILALMKLQHRFRTQDSFLYDFVYMIWSF